MINARFFIYIMLLGGVQAKMFQRRGAAGQFRFCNNQTCGKCDKLLYGRLHFPNSGKSNTWGSCRKVVAQVGLPDLANSMPWHARL